MNFAFFAFIAPFGLRLAILERPNLLSQPSYRKSWAGLIRKTVLKMAYFCLSSLRSTATAQAFEIEGHRLRLNKHFGL
jgi:hypothetical protein